MILKVDPSPRLRGIIFPPTSKSYTIRAFLIAALGGKSEIINSSGGIDCNVARDCAIRLGADIKKLKNNNYIIKGVVRNKKLPKKLYVKESGTTLRFLISIVSLFSGRTTIIGSGTLRSRPNKPLLDTLMKLGLKIKGTGPKGAVPISIEGKKLKGRFISVDGTLSSQFISSLLISASCFDGQTNLRITGDYVVSQPYIDMTISVLKKAGVKIFKINNRSYRIPGNQNFKGLGRFAVPPDYGLSGFFLAAAALVKSDILIKNLVLDDMIQADKKIIFFLEQMGAGIIKSNDGIRIRGPAKLKGGKFVLRDSPDLVPVLGILALFAKGRTRLCGIKHVRIKESNRITNFRQELIKLGAKIQEKQDELIIHPISQLKKYARLNPHNDHRLAMAFCVLGLVTGTIVDNIECISKSYPDFLKDLTKIGARVSKAKII